MRKLLFVLIGLVFLVACGEEADSQPVEDVSTSDSEQIEEEPLADYEELPFDVKAVEDDYNDLLSDDTVKKLAFSDKIINMAEGNLAEATVLLSALNLNYGDGEFDEIASELAKGLDESNSFSNNFTVEDVSVHVTAIHEGFVKVEVTRE